MPSSSLWRLVRINRRKIKVLTQSFFLSAVFVVGWTFCTFPSGPEEVLREEGYAHMHRNEDRRPNFRPKVAPPPSSLDDPLVARASRKPHYGETNGLFLSDYGVPYCKPTIHFLMTAHNFAPNAYLWGKWFEDIEDTLSYSVHVHCETGKSKCQESIPAGRLREKLVTSVEHIRCNDINHIVQMIKTALEETARHKSSCPEHVEDRYIVVDAAAIPLMPFKEMYSILTEAQSGFCLDKQSEWQSAAWKTGSQNDWIPKTQSFFMLTQTQAKALKMSHERSAFKTICDRGECCTDEFWPFVASNGLLSGTKTDSQYSTSKFMGEDTMSKWVDREIAKHSSQGLCKHTFAPRFGEGRDATTSDAKEFAAHVGVLYEESFGEGLTVSDSRGVFHDASPSTWKILAKSGYLFAGAIFGLQSAYVEDVQRILFKKELAQARP